MSEWMPVCMSVNVSLTANYENNIPGFKEKIKVQEYRKSFEHFKAGVS